MELFKKKLDFYTSIDDLVIDNWFAIQKTNDISYLLKVRKVISREEDRKTLEAAFEKIWREYLDTFGINDTMREILELKRDILVDQCDMYLNNDRSKITFINIKKAELKRLLEGQETGGFDNTKGYVEKYLGFRLNGKEVTVREYYGYVKMLEDHITQTKQQTADVGE